MTVKHNRKARGLSSRRMKRIALPFQLTKTSTKLLAKAPGIDAQDINSMLGNVTIEALVRSINLVDSLRKKGETLPDYMEQHLEDLDFHKAEVNVNVQKPGGWRVRGPKWLKVELELIGRGAKANDVGPKTEWKPRGDSAEIEVGVENGADAKLIPIIKPTVKFTFKYKWDPLVATVASGASGRLMTWEFNREKNKFLQGGQKLVILFERPRNVKKMSLKIKKITMKLDLRLPGGDKAETIKEGTIDVIVRDRKTTP